MAVTFNNTVFGAAQATTGAYLLNTFTGTSLLSGLTPVTINGSIDLPGSVVQVPSISIAGVTSVGAQGTYLGYSAASGGNYVYYFAVTAANIITPVVIGVTGAPALPALNVATPVLNANVTAPIGPNTPCYAAGTLIRTVRGEVAVEDLAIGDEVITASGGRRPIIWLGHRRTDCAGHPEPELVQPIRITANAVAPGMPARDLRISPDHALFFDTVLVQARFLVNGSTILRENVDAVTYWHVELETHDILVAENMPSESFLDVGNRWAFAEGGAVAALHPRFEGAEAAGHCAPLVTEGERLIAIRAWLTERARHLGARMTADPAIQLLADNILVTPLAVNDGCFVYAVPEGAEALRLVSRTAVPAETLLESTDTRRLGICVTALQLDGADIELDDPRLADGWNTVEDGFRWTSGEATLPLARSVMLRAHGLPAYPVAAPRLCEDVARPVMPLSRAG
ncbi:Hint domain-containing protein [Sphingomonas profundi]|uniref:Hint domain-containing protein n=1 Tax=Alterirhizorhabdus profundi TaxID=2681549 RepID=UPI0012E94B08|nr:Hint domain-containing protein [Sphingomonas profundi]